MVARLCLSHFAVILGCLLHLILPVLTYAHSNALSLIITPPNPITLQIHVDPTPVKMVDRVGHYVVTTLSADVQRGGWVTAVR